MTAVADLTTVAGAEALSAPPITSPSITAQIFDDLAAVEPLWRAIEAEGVGSPYQRFDWVRAYVEALAAHERFGPRIVVLKDVADRPVMLLPLAVHQRCGFQIASVIGGKHANYHAPILGPHAPALAAEAFTAVLVAVGRQLGIDAYDFINLPGVWQSRPNPLVLPSAGLNPSNAYSLTLGSSAEDTLKRALGKDARKRVRQKERYLAALGPVTHRVARNLAEVDRILDTYFAQKAERFRVLGLPIDVEIAPMRAFVRRACLAGLETACPAVELHALEVGDRIVAIFGVAVDRMRGSGMFTSFDGAAEVARCSPGDLLLTRIIATQCERGRTAFDLGVGEARYKSTFCGETDQLFTLVLPVTVRGHAYAGALRSLVSAKHFVKRTPWAWRAVGALRNVRAKLRAW